METAYTFSDVTFKPQYSKVKSRSTDVDLTSKVGKLDLSLPLISANMADITESSMVFAMKEAGGLGILHRFMSIKENVEMFIYCWNQLASYAPTNVPLTSISKHIGVSVGIGKEGKKRFKKLHKAGAKTFCLDVAHGHHINVKKMLKWIRKNYKDENMTIIAGNVATAEGALDIYNWGADVIKVGIGPGSCCQTRENTGVGVPQLSALVEIREALPEEAYIISDGGIKKTGDIAKALKYADAVMMGGFFAGTTETPGHVYETMDGNFYKTMAGSASAESKVRSGNKNSFVEGGIRQVPFRGHVKYILAKAKENVQSSFSYSGAKNMKKFKYKAELIKISGGGKKESKI